MFLNPTVNFNPATQVFANKNLQNNLCFRGLLGGLNYLNSDKFELSEIDNDVLVGKILDKLPYFTVDDYKNLSEHEKNILREKYDKLINGSSSESDLGNIDDNNRYMYFKDIEYKHDKASELLKSFFNNEYGENNYRVVTIGRSLSSIGKVLGYKIGEDNVVNIPLSIARKYLNPIFLKECIEENGDGLQKYLEEHSLTKEQIKNSGKKIIVLDFCATGDSLRGARNLFRDSMLMGDENVEYKNVLECMPNEVFFMEYFNDLFDCHFKVLSFSKLCTDLDGEPGLGKTRTMMWWASNNNAIYVSAVKTMTTRWLLENITKAIGGTTFFRSSDLLDQIEKSLIRNPRVLIVDEIDYLVSSECAVEILRDIHDRTQVPVILVGMSRSNQHLKRFEHLYDRFSEVMHFSPFNLGDINDIVKELSEVKFTPQAVGRIYKDKNGLRQIVKLINNAELLAKDNDLAEIGLKEVEQLLRKELR